MLEAILTGRPHWEEHSEARRYRWLLCLRMKRGKEKEEKKEEKQGLLIPKNNPTQSRNQNHFFCRSVNWKTIRESPSAGRNEHPRVTNSFCKRNGANGREMVNGFSKMGKSGGDDS